MSKGYIKKERLRLLNTKVFFLHIVKEITHIVHTVSHSVDTTRQLIDCKEMTHFQNNRLCMLIDLVDNVMRYSTPLTQ